MEIFLKALELGKLVFSERQSVFSLQSDMMGSSYSSSSSSSEMTKKNNRENVDVGSTGRVSSLMDNDRSKQQQQRPGSGEGFVMLSRSKTVATSKRISTLQESNPCPPPNKCKGCNSFCIMPILCPDEVSPRLRWAGLRWALEFVVGIGLRVCY